jgi:predicted Zn-dependent peptidase
MKRIIIILSVYLLPGGIINAQSYNLPPYQKFKLKNGLTVYLMEQHEVPIISVSVILPAGAIYDGEKSGLASLTASALKHGTKNFTKAKLDEELDFLGASISAGASKESANLSARMAAKDKDKVLNLLKEVLLEPTFDAAEFEKEKKRLLVSLEQQKESPRSVIGSYFDKFLYGDHVYGNIVQGKISTVTLLTADDVRKFYSENYSPDGAAIAVAGDFKTAEMKVAITTLFAGWQKAAKAQVNLASKPIGKPAKQQVLLVNKDDAKETTFYIGAPGISRNNPDFVAVDVINTLFGGRFTSMLNDELRVNTGLTYGANSRFSALKNGGSFVISTFTAGNTTEPAVDKALEVLNKLHKDGIDEKALTSAKNYVKGQFPPRYETAGQLAGLMTTMFWYNFDETFINNFEKNVDGLTLDKAKEIIAKYFPKDKLQFVLVGKSADIRKIAEKYGPVTEVQIKEEVKKAF